MARISNIDAPPQEKKAVQDALEELTTQRVLYESLGRGPEHAEEEKRQASKVVDAMHKVSHVHTDTKIGEEYQRKLQAGKFWRANRKERRGQVNSLLKEFAPVVQSPEMTSHEGKELIIQGKELSIQGNELSIQGNELSIQGNELSIQGNELSTQGKDEVTISKEIVWKNTLDELNKQLVLYDCLGQGHEQISEEEQAAKVVDAMYKVSDAHTDPKVKREYRKKAEKFEKASPEERKKEMNALLKGLLILLATPFLLAGAAIFAAGSVLYGVGSIVKGLGNLVTGRIWDSSSDNKSQNASDSGQEE